jgi:hypothetical protein
MAWAPKRATFFAARGGGALSRRSADGVAFETAQYITYYICYIFMLVIGMVRARARLWLSFFQVFVEQPACAMQARVDPIGRHSGGGRPFSGAQG